MGDITIIEKKLNSQPVILEMAARLGIDPNDERAKNETFRYASSVLAEIKKSMSDPKRDLSGCNPDTIAQAMVDAATFRLPIDGTQKAHLIKYGNSVQLQIGFRGYISKITELYKDADFTAEAIFDGDKFTVRDDEGYQTYVLEKSDPFANDWGKLKGVMVKLSYTKGGEKYQKISVMPKSDLEKARKAAKQDYIWSAWPIEKSKAAAIKRACKVQFADVMGLQEMIRYDNEANFDQTQLASPVRSSIVDNINQELSPSEKIIDAEIMEDISEVDIDAELAELTNAGNIEAAKGVGAYTTWLATLAPNDKESIRPMHKQWSAAAKAHDAAQTKPDSDMEAVF